jgi:hypothetical protein
MACSGISTSSKVLEEKILPPVFSNMDLLWGKYYQTLCFPNNSSHLVFGGLPIQLDAKFAELTVNIDLPIVPEKLTAYKVIRPLVDESYTHGLAQRTGFNDSPVFYTTDNTFRVYNGDPNKSNSPVFTIYKEGTIVIYLTRNEEQKSLDLPSNEECINIGRKWLNSHNLYPKDVIKITTTPNVVHVMSGYTESQYTAANWVSFIIGLDGYELFGMGAYLLIGENGEVRKVCINAPEFEPYTYIRIQKPEVTLDIFQDYQLNPEKFRISTPECLTRNINRYISIENISLKYLAMINPDNSQEVYAQPIYIFEGQGRNQPDLKWDSFIGACDAVVR